MDAMDQWMNEWRGRGMFAYEWMKVVLSYDGYSLDLW